jgi:hypothetical protein
VSEDFFDKYRREDQSIDVKQAFIDAFGDAMLANNDMTRLQLSIQTLANIEGMQPIRSRQIAAVAIQLIGCIAGVSFASASSAKHVYEALETELDSLDESVTGLAEDLNEAELAIARLQVKTGTE